MPKNADRQTDTQVSKSSTDENRHVSNFFLKDGLTDFAEIVRSDTRHDPL
jgi:hypothetical protein